MTKGSYQRGTTTARRRTKAKVTQAGRTQRAQAAAAAMPKKKPYKAPIDKEKYQSTKGLVAMARATKAKRKKKQ